MSTRRHASLSAAPSLLLQASLFSLRHRSSSSSFTAVILDRVRRMRVPSCPSTQLRQLAMAVTTATYTPVVPSSAGKKGPQQEQRQQQQQTSAFRLVEKRYKSRVPPAGATLTHTEARRQRRRGTSWRPALTDVWDLRELFPAGGPRPSERANGEWGEAQLAGVECFEVGQAGVKAWAVKAIPGELTLPAGRRRCLREAALTASVRPILAPGLVVLPAYLESAEQRKLVGSCLADYTQPPNWTNLDQHFVLPEPPATLWSLYSAAVASRSLPDAASPAEEAVIRPRHASLTSAQVAEYDRMPSGRTLVQNTEGERLTADEVAQTGSHRPEPSTSARSTRVTQLLKELRWTNIGLFYDVGPSTCCVAAASLADRGRRVALTVVEQELRLSAPHTVPGAARGPAGAHRKDRDRLGERLRAVRRCRWVCRVARLGRKLRCATLSALPSPRPNLRLIRAHFRPAENDAGIINAYQTHDSLMAHVDRSELDPHRPLVSVSSVFPILACRPLAGETDRLPSSSLGLSAIFLLGGSTRDEAPLPLLLRSGDVIVLSGPSRRSYHGTCLGHHLPVSRSLTLLHAGIPRVLDGTLPSHFSEASTIEDDSSWDPVMADYLRTTRCARPRVQPAALSSH